MYKLFTCNINENKPPYVKYQMKFLVQNHFISPKDTQLEECFILSHLAFAQIYKL